MIDKEKLTIENLRGLSISDPLYYLMFAYIDAGILDEKQGLIFMIMSLREHLIKVQEIKAEEIRKSPYSILMNTDR